MELALQFAFDTIIDNQYLDEDKKIEIIKGCMEGGININKGNILMNVFCMGYHKITKFLLDNGVKITDEDFLEACGIEDPITVKLFLEYGTDAKMQDNKPIKYCRDVQTAKLLVEYGADPFCDERIFGRACQISYDLVKYYIDLGIQCNTLSSENVFNTFNSITNYEITKLLLNNGVDPNMTHNSKSILLEQLENVSYDNCKILLEYGANIESCRSFRKFNFKNQQGMYLYKRSMRVGDITELFLSYGLDINQMTLES